MDALLPGRYRDVLYIDGDTQIVDALDPLLARELPSGRLLAAPDYATILDRFDWPWATAHRAHLDALGLVGEQRERWFNTGVVRASRETWRRVGEAALEFCARHDELLLFADQSALNAVAIDDVDLVPSRWNYPKQFLYLDVPGVGEGPAIVHYMANPKPWHGVFHPWDRDACAPYDALARARPALATLRPRLDPKRRLWHALRDLRLRLGLRPGWYPDDARLRAALFPARA